MHLISLSNVKHFLIKPFNVGAQSWKKEYERLSEDVPCVELDKIEEHTDEVLHVAFSNNGMMFCTCSKDAYVKVGMLREKNVSDN